MEDTRQHDACSSCGSALIQADLEWLHVGEVAEETVFELELESIERAAIIDALIANKIRHRWDDTHELVVADANVDAVEEILDEVLGEEDESENDDDEDDDDSESSEDDDGYETLSELFVVVDKLLKKRDAERILEYHDAVELVLETTIPFGIDAEIWADIQSAARNTSVALDQDSRASVDADLKGLYNQLQLLV